MTDSTDLKIRTWSEMAYVQKSFSKQTDFSDVIDRLISEKFYILQTDLKGKILDWS